MLVLKLAAGLLWTVTYALIIRRSALDRAPGMPMTALCINISWELYYSVVSPHPAPQLYVNWVWLLFDVVIFAQFVKYGRQEVERALSPGTFLPVLLFTLVMASLTDKKRPTIKPSFRGNRSVTRETSSRR